MAKGKGKKKVAVAISVKDLEELAEGLREIQKVVAGLRAHMATAIGDQNDDAQLEFVEP